MNFLKKYIFFIIVLLGLAGYYIYKMPKFGSGDKAPGFSAPLIDGSTFSLDDLKGKYVLLDFWGSWCGPCRRESSDLVELYKNFSHKKFKDAQGFEIVSVGIETNPSRWKKAILQDHLSWKYHIIQKDRFKGKIAKLYGVREIPTKYLLDKNGKVLMTNPRFEEIISFLDSKSMD